MSRPRVLLADDHPIVAEGVKRILEKEFDVVGIVEDGSAMIEAAQRLRPDVIVADISMPRLNGIDALKVLKRDGFKVPVVFLTMHHDPAYARRAFEAGACGFVLKHSAPTEFLLAVNTCLSGAIFVTDGLIDEPPQSATRPTKPSLEQGMTLTKRQREILRLLAEGKSAKAVAGLLHISPRTVEDHKYRIMGLHSIQSSAELVRFAIRQGIVS